MSYFGLKEQRSFNASLTSQSRVLPNPFSCLPHLLDVYKPVKCGHESSYSAFSKSSAFNLRCQSVVQYCALTTLCHLQMFLAQTLDALGSPGLDFPTNPYYRPSALGGRAVEIGYESEEEELPDVSEAENQDPGDDYQPPPGGGAGGGHMGGSYHHHDTRSQSSQRTGQKNPYFQYNYRPLPSIFCSDQAGDSMPCC